MLNYIIFNFYNHSETNTWNLKKNNQFIRKSINKSKIHNPSPLDPLELLFVQFLANAIQMVFRYYAYWMKFPACIDQKELYWLI
jgi:hypothetical protein